MCGIFALLNTNQLFEVAQVCTGILRELSEAIERRGPDYCSPIVEHEVRCGLSLKLKASVLHFRGESLQRQPVIDDEGNLLMFNGQIYRFANESLDRDISDTEFLAKELKKCDTQRGVANVFAEIDGPFAFVYLHNKTNSLFYGRDIFGRKSLCSLTNPDKSTLVAISSVATTLQTQSLASLDPRWDEIDSDAIYCIDFTRQYQPKQKRFYWNTDSIYPPTFKCRRINRNDLCDENIIKQKYLKPLLEEETVQQPNFPAKLNETKLDVDSEILGTPKLLNLDPTSPELIALEEKLLRAVERRVSDHRPCINCRRSKIDSGDCRHSKVAIAFSGGVDSTLIAVALDKILDLDETIDLVTVAFKWGSPDRTSVGEAYNELKRICPCRNWRLVVSDISINELMNLRQQSIRNLILPCNTVLDDSLGCACWFIGRAKGRALDSCGENKFFLDDYFQDFLEYQPDGLRESIKEVIIQDYISPATVLFAGSSIDEQLGGYGSHRYAWIKDGARGVFQEISFLMRRLSQRNLGRDDRVYSDHGRDLRLPYLDFEFVSYLNQLPIASKMNLNLSPEVGPKRILRSLAFKWHLHKTCLRTKRALQFGTRIANLEQPNEKADDLCPRLIQ